MEQELNNEQEVTQNPELSQESVQENSISDKDRNFAALREKSIQAQRERDAAMAELQRLKEAQQKQELSTAHKPTLDPDDLVEARYLDEKIKELKDELKGYQTKITYESQEAKLKAEFPDIESVVSQENLQTLSQLYPELADSIRSNSNLYSKGKAAYTLIKKMGIHQEDKYSSEKERIAQNSNKPRPLTSLNAQEGNSPLSRANIFAEGLTPELKKQLYKEMIESSKKV